MPKMLRVTGLPRGAADLSNREVRFSLATEKAGVLDCVAPLGVAQQVIAGLARMCAEIRAALMAEQGTHATAVEQVAAAHIQKERWHDLLIVQFVTPEGVPYTFGMPAKVAADIAARLKTESRRRGQVGRA